MNLPAAGVGLGAFCGLTLLFSELRWFQQVGLVERLEPYSTARPRQLRGGVLSVVSFRDVIAPLSRTFGARLARLLGVDEELAIRLERIHSPLSVTELRVRQVGGSAVALGIGCVTAVGLGLSPLLAIFAVLGPPTLVFLWIEQGVARASATWQRKIFLELPVVTEQLAMLLSAGWSLGAGLARIAQRGDGACSRDLRRVQARIQQGLGAVESLREWGDVARVDELDSLIAVLALNRETADLGTLIGEVARSIRREAQRNLIESIERRSQQVWIPVTVATLVPGVLLMGVPFIDALTMFS